MKGEKGILRGLSSYFQVDIYIRLLPYIRPYKLLMGIAIVLILVQEAFALLDPWPMKILVDSGLGKIPLPDWLPKTFPFLADGNQYNTIIFAVLAGIALWLVGNALDIVGSYIKNRVNEGITLTFKADLFNHLQRLSFLYHDQTSVGDSIYRLNNDTGFISTMVWGNFRHLLTSLVTLIGILLIVIQLDWQLALLALGAAPILYLAAARFGRHFKTKTKRVKVMESTSQTILQEVLSCLRVVKAFGQEEREQKRYEEQSWTALKARLRLKLEQSLFSSSLSFITKLDRSLILLIGAFHVADGHLSVGGLLVILAYVGQIHGPLETIGETLTDMQLSLVSAERALEVLDIAPEIQDNPGVTTLDHVEGSIAFEDVNFAYSGDRFVLRNINFRVQPGEVIAIVGPTGAGKTTLSSLLARFYDPSSGHVVLDGYDLRNLSIETLRDNIAMVSQEPTLFTGTIHENICYGRPNAHMYEIEAAARAAGAHEFIISLPEGYNTEVGARGVRLSGGERQRIAIARAFIKNAPVLILDEPTSAVDSRTEMVILNALDRLMIGRTTFIIAHRLSTIRYADQIFVIDKGHIVERGTHAELLVHDGLYAQFYRIQSGAFGQHRQVEGEVVEIELEEVAAQV